MRLETIQHTPSTLIYFQLNLKKTNQSMYETKLSLRAKYKK